MDIVKELARNLKQKRTEKGYTREKLGTLAEVSPGTIALYENGTSKAPSLPIVAKLAQALEVSIDELCGIQYTASENFAQGEIPLTQVLKKLYFLLKIGILQNALDVGVKIALRHHKQIANGDETIGDIMSEEECEKIDIIHRLPKNENWFVNEDKIISNFISKMNSVEQVKASDILDEEIFQIVQNSVYEKFNDYVVIVGKSGYQIVNRNNHKSETQLDIFTE